jgi:hypothetical protein
VLQISKSCSKIFEFQKTKFIKIPRFGKETEENRKRASEKFLLKLRVDEIRLVPDSVTIFCGTICLVRILHITFIELQVEHISFKMDLTTSSEF